VVTGFITTHASLMVSILFILGLVVGYLNVSETESTAFLIATITLIVGSAAFNQILRNAYLTTILGNFIAFVTAAAFVVSIKVVLETSEK